MLEQRTFTIIFSIVYLSWGLSEIAIGYWLRTKVDAAKDAGTLKLVLRIAYASVAVAIFLGIRDDGILAPVSTAAYVGTICLLLGMAIRFYAIATLRRFFTVNVTLREGHRLVRSGLYRWIRHPSYTGSLLSFYGFAIALQNVWAAIILVVPITYAFFVRMRVEEQVLRDAFPDEYADYERATRRLVPFIY